MASRYLIPVLFLLLAALPLVAQDTIPAQDLPHIVVVTTGSAQTNQTNVSTKTQAKTVVFVHDESESERRFQRKILVSFMAGMLIIAGVYRARRRGNTAVV